MSFKSTNVYLIEKNMIYQDFDTLNYDNKNFCWEHDTYLGKSSLVIDYPCTVNNNNVQYVYCTNLESREMEESKYCNKRYILTYENDTFHLKKDENFILKLYNASHNLQVFNINNIFFGIGGQAEMYNPEIQQSNNPIQILDCPEEKLPKPIISPYYFNDYFKNGLYLFFFNSENHTQYSIENNKLPILRGIEEGRMDAFYTYKHERGQYPLETVTMYFNQIMDETNSVYKDNLLLGGLSAFDSNTTVIYSKQEKMYYLYQRANPFPMCRYIQCCKSTDLINWSKFYPLKFTPRMDINTVNMYQNHFFSISNVHQNIGILLNSEIDKTCCSTPSIGLYYSDNYIDWTLQGDVTSGINIPTSDDGHQYKDFMKGPPIELNNKIYFFLWPVILPVWEEDQGRKYLKNLDDEDVCVSVYSFKKNRFTYVSNKITDSISHFILKPISITNNFIKINIKIENSGFLKVQLLDKNLENIERYSFLMFDIISENTDSFDYILSWNGNTEIDFTELVHIEIEGINFELYSIEY